VSPPPLKKSGLQLPMYVSVLSAEPRSPACLFLSQVGVLGRILLIAPRKQIAAISLAAMHAYCRVEFWRPDVVAVP